MYRTYLKEKYIYSIYLNKKIHSKNTPQKKKIISNILQRKIHQQNLPQRNLHFQNIPQRKIKNTFIEYTSKNTFIEFTSKTNAFIISSVKMLYVTCTLTSFNVVLLQNNSLCERLNYFTISLYFSARSSEFQDTAQLSVSINLILPCLEIIQQRPRSTKEGTKLVRVQFLEQPDIHFLWV